MQTINDERKASPKVGRLHDGQTPSDTVFRRRLVLAGLALVAVFAMGTEALLDGTAMLLG